MCAFGCAILAYLGLGLQSLLGSGGTKTKDKYTRLDNAMEEDNQNFIAGHQEQQQVNLPP